MRTNQIENEIVELEKRYWRALEENDVEAMLELTDFPCIVAGPQGIRSFDQDAFEQMMSKPQSYSIEKAELKGAEVRVLRDDVAVVAYQVKEQVTVDGKSITLQAADSSTWIRRDGQWRCALHAEALAGDPFGRDRNAG